MAITDQQYSDWLLESDAARCILVEVSVKSGVSEITRYLSSKPFVDSVGGQAYEPIINGNSISIVERARIDDRGFLSFGDIEIWNKDGENDSWLNDVWTNRDLVALLGDVRWLRSDFRTIFTGVSEDIDSSNNSVLNIKLRDKLERLNTPVYDIKLGGSTQNKNKLVPLTFGEVHNISPLLSNPATLEFQVHNGNVESIIEVRDNGVPVGFTPTLSTGKFTLNASPSPSSKITASVQGDKVGSWFTTTKEIIEQLVTRFGETSINFSTSDLDIADLVIFDTANPQPLGIYLSSKINLLSACNSIAQSIGAQLLMTRLGKLRLLKVDLPPSGTPIEITNDDIILDSLQIKEKVEVSASKKVGFVKNWTIQRNLETGIPEEHKDMYETEWYDITISDSSTKTDYRLNAEPQMKETFMLTSTDASAEATRLLNLFKTPRFIYEFRGTPNLVELNLGDPVTITHERFGLQGGKTGVVVGLSINWSNLLVNVEVFA